MRWLVCLLLVACTQTHGDPGHCPVLAMGTDPMTLVGTRCLLPSQISCFEQDDFSPCNSGFYRCVNEVWTLDHQLDAHEGQSCADSPIDSCTYEGHPDCTTPPTSAECGCGSDGLWHCTCACPGGQYCP